MEIKIDRIVDHGHTTERVEMTVTQDCDLGYYILADTTYTRSGQLSNKLRHMHWFADKKVKCGDQVILYTKKGRNSSSALESGTTKYIIYWQLDINVWNNEGDAALLLHTNQWRATKVN
jgi:hypothetical protein